MIDLLEPTISFECEVVFLGFLFLGAVADEVDNFGVLVDGLVHVFDRGKVDAISDLLFGSSECLFDIAYFFVVPHRRNELKADIKRLITWASR